MDSYHCKPRKRKKPCFRAMMSSTSFNIRSDSLSPHLALKDRAMAACFLAISSLPWARQTIANHNLDSICPLLFSWVSPLQPHQKDKSLKQVPTGQRPISRRELAEKIIADALPVRFQAQLHKIIWPPDQRGV